MSCRRRGRDAHTGSRDISNGHSRPPGHGKASCAERCLGRKLADRRGLRRPDVSRSSGPSGRGIFCESGRARWGDREAARRGEYDSEGVVSFRWGGFSGYCVTDKKV